MPLLDETYTYSFCEVKTTANELLFTGVVDRVSGGSLDITGNGDNLPLLERGTFVKINIFNDALGFKILVGSIYLSGKTLVRVTDLQNLADYERRNFFRIRVDIRAKAYAAEGELAAGFPIHVLDLSLSGLFMKTKQKLADGQIFKVTLNLPAGEPVLCRCIVQREHADENVYGYGCSFLDNSSAQTDTICKYIFQKQREQIRIAKALHPDA